MLRGIGLENLLLVNMWAVNLDMIHILTGNSTISIIEINIHLSLIEIELELEVGVEVEIEGSIGPIGEVGLLIEGEVIAEIEIIEENIVGIIGVEVMIGKGDHYHYHYHYIIVVIIFIIIIMYCYLVWCRF